MKKPYQIESQRAVRRLEEMAVDGNPAIRMVLPMAEMVGWLRQGVRAFDSPSRAAIDGAVDGGRGAGSGVVGERSRPQPDRTANRVG